MNYHPTPFLHCHKCLGYRALRGNINTRRLLSLVFLVYVAFANPYSVYANLVVPQNGLIGYWTGNNTAVDSSPLANNGSFSGSYVAGAPGGAAFDLGTAKVVIPNNPAYDFTRYSGFSVGFWFNANGTTVDSTHGLFLGEDDEAGYRPKWFIDYGNTVYGPNHDFVLHFNDFNTERIFLTSNPVAFPTGWNQFTVTDDSGLVTFYLNGNSIGAASLGSYVLRPSAPLIFGYAEGLTYNGLMNNVVIYDRGLSSSEVKQLATVPDRANTLFLLLLSLSCLFMFGVRRRIVFHRARQVDVMR